MIRLIAVFFLSMSTLLFADEKADIQSTISDQLRAFASDNFIEAFTHASPGIKDIFGTVENFSNMVKKGYPMVWRYNNFEFLNLEETPQGYSQIVRITDQNDKLFLLKYFMKNVAGIWKISGVSIIEASDFSA
ncbi:MAG: DUF4864 domain-containing protein [Paracoccaceae bacterium]|nr:DUF4864 domain-containing protein [Marinovum sp.]MDP6191354.1 DUF4864 domain-containing protein [Paracoccaceae bacterium]NCV48689.1 DUF4864 domain-containing protein [Rhodobacterales bacterium]NDA28980.1 DUF4864 domain-containing protein [Alphaproteobacteria bacterium]OUV45276.1 MAG: hypothetical protein CBC71_00615 [Rhodobacteraceae bacterium TMED111]